MGSPSVYGAGYARLSQIEPRCCSGLWNCVNRVVSYVSGAVSKPAAYVGKLIATEFFFPLTKQAKQAQLKLEEAFRARFWTGDSVPPLNNQKIIESFNQPFDKSYIITLNNGKKVTLTCSVIESKSDLVQGTASENAPFYNLVCVAGNHSTNESTITGVYSYLDAFLDKRREQEIPSKGRVIVITGYNITDDQRNLYIPKTLDEAGCILKEALCAMQEDYGSIDQIVGHSLGGILLGAAMKHFTRPFLKFLPRNILYDRCPYSIYAACKNVSAVGIPIGQILFPLVKLLGWSLDLADEISEFCKQNKGYMEEKRSNIISIVAGPMLCRITASMMYNLACCAKIKNLMKEGLGPLY